MALKVASAPLLSRPGLLQDVPSIRSWLQDLYMSLVRELSAMDTRLNASVQVDGSEPFVGPPILPSYLKTELPDVTTPAQAIYVSNEAGGATMAFSDGVHWRRVQDRAIVS